MKEANEQEILKAVEALPICVDGKNGIKDLLRALGYSLKPAIKAGQVWENQSTPILLIDLRGAPKAMSQGYKEGELVAIALDSCGGWLSMAISEINKNSEAWKLLANSLEEYYKQK